MSAAAKTLDKLVQRIENSPYDHALWQELFALQNDHEKECPSDDASVDKLRLYRNKYVEKFEAPLSFWIEWIQFELERATSSASSEEYAETQKYMRKFFSKALQECPHYDIAHASVYEIKERHESELATANDVRAAFEEALGYCGLDVISGAKLWTMYREFEAEDVEDIASQQQEQEGTDTESLAGDLVASKRRLSSIYQRQLSLPLMNTEETLSHLEADVGGFYTEADMAYLEPEALNRKVESALKKRQVLEPFEQRVAPFETLPGGRGGGGEEEGSSTAAYTADEVVDAWCAYEEAERSAGEVNRARRVLERAVLSVHALYGSSSDPITTAAVHRMWKYCSERAVLFPSSAGADSNDDNSSHYALRVSARALKTCYTSLSMWRLHWLAQERAGVPAKQVQDSHHSALQAGLQQGEDYVQVLVSLGQYLGRNARQVMLAVTADAGGGREEEGEEEPVGKRRKRGHSSSQALKLHLPSSDASTTDGSSLVESLGLYFDSSVASQQWLLSYYPKWEQGWADWASGLQETHHSVLRLMMKMRGGSVSTKLSQEQLADLTNRPSSSPWDMTLACFPTSLAVIVAASRGESLALVGDGSTNDQVVLQKIRAVLDRAIDECSLLLQSAGATVATAADLHYLCTEWEAMERKHGDHSSIAACLFRAATMRHKHAVQISSALAPTTASPSYAASDEQSAAAAVAVEPAAGNATAAKKTAKKAKNKASTSSIQEEKGTKMDVVHPTSASSSASPSLASSSSAAAVADPQFSTSTVKISNLHFGASEADVQAALRDFAMGAGIALSGFKEEREGEEEKGEGGGGDKDGVSVYLPRAYSGRSKGTAYVTLYSTEEATALVEAAADTDADADSVSKFSVKGRPAKVSALDKSKLALIIKERDAPPTTTVFVSGFPTEWQTEHLLSFCAHCGDIVAAKILMKKQGEGMIQFADLTGRQNAFQTLNKYQFTQAGNRSYTTAVSLSKFPILHQPGDGSTLEVMHAKVAGSGDGDGGVTVTVPYVPVPVTELGKSKPKRAGIMFRPAALR